MYGSTEEGGAIVGQGGFPWGYSPHRCDRFLEELQKRGCSVDAQPELPGLYDDVPNTYIRKDGKTAVICVPHNENVSWEDIRFVCEKLDIDPKIFGCPDDLLERGPAVLLN